ncbi:MAG: rubredoxin [Desulfobacteraceae bacterium]|nr:rubredoxin [Desulfobacteraceae bacterium]
MMNPEKIHQCQTATCGFMYDPEKGDRRGKISKGTCFEDLPDSWRCPVCGATRKVFRPLAGSGCPGTSDNPDAA